jgi:hypothetical protein
VGLLLKIFKDLIFIMDLGIFLIIITSHKKENGNTPKSGYTAYWVATRAG